MMWRGKRFNVALAAGISVYANILTLIGLRCAAIASKQGDVRHIVLALDNLPNVSADSMALMKALTHADPDITAMWRSNYEYNVTFNVTHVKSFTAPDGKKRPGKLNPHAILVDWIAASCIAALNPEQLMKESELSSGDVDDIATIVTVAQSMGAAEIYNVDDPTLVAKVLKHSGR